MDTTSLSLIERIQTTGQGKDWSMLMDDYRPLLLKWLHRFEVQTCDQEDLLQEVMVVVVRDLPAFEHNGRTGAFRNWLKAILLNRLREFWRGQKRNPNRGGTALHFQLQQLQDASSDLSRLWDSEHDKVLLRHLLRLVQVDFTETTWNAFHATTIMHRPAEEVASTLGISMNAVCVAKSRVLAKLRQRAQGMLDL